MRRSAYWGVDFSGARDAGERIWLARVRRERRALRLEALLPARELPDGGRERKPALAALVALIRRERDAAFGLDFPFALPGPLLEGEPWTAFVRGFPSRFATPEAFRAWCRARTHGKEPKRRTDVLARVPFGGFNLRVYRQTWTGLRDVLAPLLADDAARVLPMQPAAADRAALIEICPASTLQAQGLYREAGRHRTYKGRGAGPRAVREALWDSLAERFALRGTPALRERALADAGGDALDAVIAACATARACEADLPIEPHCAALVAEEGYIWV